MSKYVYLGLLVASICFSVFIGYEYINLKKDIDIKGSSDTNELPIISKEEKKEDSEDNSFEEIVDSVINSVPEEENTEEVEEENDYEQEYIDIPDTIYIPEVDNYQIIEAERKAREAEECQRKMAVYNDCMEDYNRRLDDYNDCEKRSNAEVQEYNEKMQDYSECIEDYNRKLEDYNDCVSGNSPYSHCFKPSNFCYKPFPVYKSSCFKPSNFCTKTYCY